MESYKIVLKANDNKSFKREIHRYSDEFAFKKWERLKVKVSELKYSNGTMKLYVNKSLLYKIEF